MLNVMLFIAQLHAVPKVGQEEADRLFLKRNKAHFGRFISFTYNYALNESLNSSIEEFRKKTFAKICELAADCQLKDKIIENQVSANYFLGSFLNGYLDRAITLQLSRYYVSNSFPTRLSWMYSFFFPESASNFPIYLTAGAGVLSVFLNGNHKRVIGLLDWKLGVGGRLFFFKNRRLGLDIGLSQTGFVSSRFDVYKAVVLNAGLVYKFN